jgi:hypothetical protein
LIISNYLTVVQRTPSRVSKRIRVDPLGFLMIS